jgi:hypothetical protein
MRGGINTVWLRRRRQIMSMNAAVASSSPPATPGALLEDGSREALPSHPENGSAGPGVEGSAPLPRPVTAWLPAGAVAGENEAGPARSTRLAWTPRRPNGRKTRGLRCPKDRVRRSALALPSGRMTATADGRFEVKPGTEDEPLGA